MSTYGGVLRHEERFHVAPPPLGLGERGGERGLCGAAELKGTPSLTLAGAVLDRRSVWKRRAEAVWKRRAEAGEGGASEARADTRGGRGRASRLEAVRGGSSPRFLAALISAAI